jgi:ArsR family transcriptional regulator
MAKKGSRKHHQESVRPWPNLPHQHQFNDASAVFRALGESSRLRLLARLTTGEVSVSELAELEREKVTTISARLKTLYAAGLVQRRREAKHIFYVVSNARVLRLMYFANAVRARRRVIK